jgi:hypothetical protein
MPQPLKATPQSQGEVVAWLSSMCTNNLTILRFYELRLKEIFVHCQRLKIQLVLTSSLLQDKLNNLTSQKTA